MDAADESALTVTGQPPKKRRGRPPKPKPVDPARVEQPVDPARVEQVVRWYLTGSRESDIQESIIAAWPDQDVAAALAAACEKFVEAASMPRVATLGWGVSVLQEIVRRSMESSEFSEARRAVKDIMDAAEKYGFDPELPPENKK